MATFRRFRPDDVNKFSKCNLDPLTETYELSFYLQYFAQWPSLFQVCEDGEGNIVGYSAFDSVASTKRCQGLTVPRSHGEG
jgi:N-terminal acetyltransferase B complex catalytic subunit